MGSDGGGEDLVDGKAGHARGTDPAQVGEEVHTVQPAGRRDRQHDAGKPCATSGLHPACPALVGPQGCPVLHEGGPVGEEGADQAPGPPPDVGAVATTGDETLDVPGEVCPAQQRKLRRVQPVVACVAVAGDHAVVVRQGQLPDHPATTTG